MNQESVAVKPELIKQDDEDLELDMIDVDDLIVDEEEDDDDLWDTLLKDADELEEEHTKNVEKSDKQWRWIWVTGLVVTVLLLSVVAYKKYNS